MMYGSIVEPTCNAEPKQTIQSILADSIAVSEELMCALCEIGEIVNHKAPIERNNEQVDSLATAALAVNNRQHLMLAYAIELKGMLV